MPAAALPPAEELAALWAGTPWDARALAEALQAAGISCRVDAYPPGAGLSAPSVRTTRRIPGEGTQLGVYVRHEDVPAAAEALGASGALRVPEAGASGAAEGGSEACPACGAALASTAEACAECGLEFPAGE
jgi:hypothetical protein